MSLGERCVEAQKPLITLAQDSFNGRLKEAPTYVLLQTVFRIRIRTDHLAGSGSGSVTDDTDPDPDPGSAKNLPKP